MKFLTAVALALALLWVPVDGVAQEFRDPLKGVISVDPQVIVTWSDIITLKSETQFTQEVETAFELGILRAGLKTGKPPEGDPPRPLGCTLDVRPVNQNTLFVLARVSLYEMVVLWEEAELATRGFRGAGFLAQSWWEQATNVLPITDLNGTEDGQWCAEQFELAWLRANN